MTDPQIPDNQAYVDANNAIAFAILFVACFVVFLVIEAVFNHHR